MGILAQRYPNDMDRGKVMGIALGAMALGADIGLPFGGVMYPYVGKTTPFLILACLALGHGSEFLCNSVLKIKFNFND
jgi:DHA1 family solute carrier family 18 vesicular amine transporter 1/2